MTLFLLLSWYSTINGDALNHFSTTNSTWLRLSFFNQNNVYISVNSVIFFCTQELLYHCSTLLFKKDILIMIDCTFLAIVLSYKNTRIFKLLSSPITYNISQLYFLLHWLFLLFLLYITLFVPCINSVGSISAKPQAYLMKLHSMCMP